MRRQKVLVIFGTRPEAIKMGAVVNRLRQFSKEIETRVAVTGQHRSMLDQILGTFDITPDYDLDIMQDNQSLTDVTVRSLRGLEKIFLDGGFDLVLVQGDTTTGFAGALAAFYQRVPVGHVEAGLRTYNKFNPYPEEVNRIFIDVISDLCFAPTQISEAALLAEGISPEKVLVTGNTVIDALLQTVSPSYVFQTAELREIKFGGKHTLLVTTHRRENHGEPLQRICSALRELAISRNDIQLVLPVHLNPNVYTVVHDALGDLKTVHLVKPLEYPDFVNLMARSHIILTDSGGVQEEAPSLGKPVLVMRATTERPEAITAGAARLVGTDKDTIVSEVNRLLDHADAYNEMSKAINPYGDGRAAERIVQAIRHYFKLSSSLPDSFNLSYG